jgi:hypothetical protein
MRDQESSLLSEDFPSFEEETESSPLSRVARHAGKGKHHHHHHHHKVNTFD